MAINMAEKKLLAHLRMGGRPNDQVGRELVGRFARKAMEDGDVARIVRSHGMTVDDVATLYTTVIERLMPEPWMSVSGPMLVPTQWFMETHRLEALLADVARDSSSGDRTAWMATLCDIATELASATKEAHDLQYGKPSIQVSESGGLKSAGGCASVIAFLSLITASIVALL